MNQVGLIHLYHGDGKGKTTCAMGLALRCAAQGEQIVIAQFLKDGTSGECRMLAKLDNVAVLAAKPVGKFSFAMNEEEKETTRQALARTLRAAADFAEREHARMLVLDEVCGAISTGLLDEKMVLDILDHKPEELEVVLTGRDPSEELQARADYISEICKRRHPYDKGITAREGIEQ